MESQAEDAELLDGTQPALALPAPGVKVKDMLPL